MKWNPFAGALALSLGLCNSCYGFEWLDRLLGIDLDNSEAAAGYQPYSAGYGNSPYGATYAAPTYTPHMQTYRPATHYGWGSGAPAYSTAPQYRYRTYYHSPRATILGHAGHQNSYEQPSMPAPPAATYQSYPGAAPTGASQPIYAPAPNYSPGPHYAPPQPSFTPIAR
jgi:hypothetical protein